MRISLSIAFLVLTLTYEPIVSNGNNPKLKLL
jgi:hypothetical protein